MSTIPWPANAGRPSYLFSAGGFLIAAGTFPRSSAAPVTNQTEADASFRQPEVRYFEISGSEFRELGVRDTLTEPVGFDCYGPGGTIAIFSTPLFGRLGPLRAFLTPEQLVTARADVGQLDIIDTSTGDTIRSITLGVPAIPVSDSLWMPETAAYRERERREGPFQCDIEAMRPATLPRVRSVIVDPEGRIWTEVRMSPDRFAFLIMDSLGRPQAVALAPVRDVAVPPYARGDLLYVVQKDSLDVASIRTYRMRQ